MRILEMKEVAKRLRCSKGHVSKLINGKVKGPPALPCVRLGRKRGVIEATLEKYIRQIESEGRNG
jgi:excisionase family DNA binding protein